LFKQIKHGKILHDLIEAEGIKFEMLYGNDSLEKRNEVKNKLNSGEINVILASQIFDIGIDIPKLSGLILCGSGRSECRATQRVGRVCRKFPDKNQCVIVDFYDNIKFLKKHSTIRNEVYLREPGFKIIKSKEMKKI